MGLFEDDDGYCDACGRVNAECADVVSSKKTQYTFDGECYSAVTSTVPRIKAGKYSVISTMFGIYLKSESVTTDKLIVVENSPAHKIIEQLEIFWSLKEKFKSFGMLHKRGFLLHGPPGTGKTSILNIVADFVKSKDGIFIFANKVNAVANMLKNIREVEPERKIVVVFEDIDSSSGYGGTEEDFLALLDGKQSVDNVVFIATTNYLSQLPERMRLRPSRFDVVLEVAYPDYDVRYGFLKNRNLGLSEKDLVEWAKLTDGLSLAFIKELIVSVLCIGNPLKSEVIRLKQWIKTSQPDPEE